MTFALNSIFQPALNVYLHTIEGETILVSVAGNVDHNGNEVFKLNGTGRTVWDLLDGKRDLQELMREISNLFDAPEPVIRNDMELFLKELLQRRMIAATPLSRPERDV